MQEPKVYKLKHPIDEGSNRITELTVQPPKAKHLRNLPANGPHTMSDNFKLISQLTGQSDFVVGELSMDDLAGVRAIVDSFMDIGPAIGDTPSPS
jgi:hypothetical protein